MKPFSGRVLRVDEVCPEALDQGFYYEDMGLPVIVAPTRELGPEWRLVVVGGEVVAWSGYEPEGRTATSAATPAEVRNRAEGLAARLDLPDLAYVADLVEVDGELSVLELNPFSGADLSDCDRQAVVRAVHGVLRS